MAAKVCFHIIVYNDDYVLANAIEAVRPFGPIVAAEGPVGYYREAGNQPPADETRAILAAYNIPTVHGAWDEKDEMARAVAELTPPDTEFVWVIDADEVWKFDDIAFIVAELGRGRVDSVGFHFQSFYAGFDRTIGGFEYDYEVHRIQRWYNGATWATHRPPTVLAPDGRPWREHNHLSADDTARLGIWGYHYSYVWPTQMRKKAAYYYARDPRGCITDYYNRVYLPWLRGDARQRHDIEQQYRGVHNWLPERRGPTFTREFGGRHPSSIELTLPQLRRRILDELLAEK